MSNPVLELQTVDCQYGSTVALQAVSLQIDSGEKVALIGPSGAGKSTLLGLLNGALSPTRGEVQILGKQLGSLSGSQRRRVQRQVGMVYQQHNLVANLPVIHNVNAGQLGRWPLWKSLWSLVWPQQVEAAKGALAQLGLSDKLYARTDRLSGGQQQRVALARVLVQNPVVVLADEPVASVDPARAHDMMGLLTTLVDALGADRTLVVSLHDVELARAYCDRIIGLRQGHLVFDLPSAEVSDEQLANLYDLETSKA